MDNKKILDEYTDNMRRELIKKTGWRKKIGRHTVGLTKTVFVAFFLVLLAWPIYFILFAPPRYSAAETEKNEIIFYSLIENTGEMRPRFEAAMEILREYPRYYDKVVNNIDRIEISGNACPHACIKYIRYQKNYQPRQESERIQATLYVNPKAYGYKDGENNQVSDIRFASMLIHEADHIEFINQNRLKKFAAQIKCNPALNPKISFASRIASIKHRLTIIEICAIREQNKFYKALGVDSEYFSDTSLWDSFSFFNN